MKEALFYNKKEDRAVECYLCAHHCLIKDEGTGICGARKCLGEKLYSLSYGKVIASHIDPVEKKPLFHFLPGSDTYSFACAGCNFQCGFCQNWQISQIKESRKLGVPTDEISAQGVVTACLASRCRSISYTYTEPTIYFEFAFDCARLARQKELCNIFVSNGYMSTEALKCIWKYLDAVNVDLKSFRDDFYRKVCKASLKPVLDSIILMKKLGIWVEVTTLLIPGYNDSLNELEDIAGFIASLDKNIPWHVSAFHPDYKFTDVEATGLKVLEQAKDIGMKKGLNFIYLGNARSSGAEDTICPRCKKAIVTRRGFLVTDNKIKQGECGFCGEKIAGIWE